MQIARRTPILNIREVWRTENSFSDWLTTEDGLALLLEDLGIELQYPRRECQPGDFKCDIVGSASGPDGHVIVIENQFGRTDHDHLGKLLTYASMNAATTAIWISEFVSDDHRKAIDWLNEITPTTVSLYLAQIKAYRIGDSLVTPQLDVVCRPNERVKPPNTEGDAWRLQTWTAITDYLRDRKCTFRIGNPSPGSSANFGRCGKSGFGVYAELVPSRQCVKVGLWIEIPWKDEAYLQLFDHKEAIEKAIGSPLIWQRKQEQKSASILVEAPIDPRVATNLDAAKEWMFRHLSLFHQIFGPIILDLSVPAMPEDAPEAI